MASAKKRPAKQVEEQPELEPVAEVAPVEDAPEGDYSDEVAALASSQIVEEDDEAEEPTLQIQQVDENGEVVKPAEPPELFSNIEFRAQFRKLFDGPQHVPPGMPIVGPIFGPDWHAFAISPMTEPGFNATSDEVYAFLKKMMPSVLQKRENKALLIGGFLITQIYIAMSIIRARQYALIEAQAAQKDGQGEPDSPPPVQGGDTAKQEEYALYGS